MLKNIIHGLNEATTIISFAKKISDIKNFNDLPDEVQKEIKGSATIESNGFQELVGHDKNNRVSFSAMGHWNQEGVKTDKFTITSYGSRNYQWSEGKGLKKLSGLDKFQMEIASLNERGKEFGITVKYDGRTSIIMERKDWSKPIVVRLTAEVVALLDAYSTLKRFGLSY